MFPFRSTILHEKSQLQDLNYRLESYLAKVRQLEKENQLLTTEIQHLRREGRTEGNNAYLEEIKKMRWELKELMFEKAKAEMQQHNLWQEIQELQNHLSTEQTACKNISRELAEHQKALQQTETTNATLKEYVFELQGECQILEAQHEQAKREMREIRRPPQALVTRGYYAAPLTEEDLENYAHAFSEMWQESFEIYKSKIEELETAIQQDRERGEELNEERVFLIREIEALRKEYEDQCNLQDQLENDFLTFEQKRDVDVKEYQRATELLEDEKQHLTSVITLNLKEQQQLMQVKMGLSLELATYRALLEAEHAKHQGLEEQLQKSRQGADTRSPTYGVVVRPTRDILDEKKWKLINIDIPSSFRRDTVIIKTGITPKPAPSGISMKKIINSSFSDGDLLCTDDKLSSSIQNGASSARPINAYRDATRFTPTPYDPYSTMKEAQVQHKVFPEKIDSKSKVLSRGEEHVAEVATHKSMIRVKESVNDNESDVSDYEDNKVKSQSLNELPQSLSEVEDYEFNRSTEPTKEEEYERQPSKGVIIVQHAPKEVEFKVDLSNVGPHITPDRYIRTTEEEAGGEITSMIFQSDNVTEKNKEEPTMKAVEEIGTKTSAEEPDDNQAIIISKEETSTNNIRIGDIIQTVIKPTDLEKINVSPESAITYHIEEKEVLDDGTTKTEITIQSRREETVDVADEHTLQEVLNKDVKSPELQLKGALEHLTGSKTDSFIDGLLSLGFKGREAPGKVSVNFEVSEQTSERSDEPDDASTPAETIPLSLGSPLGTEENDLEGKDDNYEEVLNITMTAEDFRKTMLSNTEPVLQKFMESSTSFSSSNEKAQEVVKEEAELFGINKTEMKLQNLQDNEGTENFEQTKVTRQDSLSRELFAPRIIEESIKVPQDVQASIVQLLNKEMEDPKLKLKGALEQLKGAVPENLRDELSVLTRDIQEGSDNVSINIKNVQQSSQSGVVTIEAEVNVSQSLDPEDFYSMEQYNEDEIESGLKFLNTQQQIQELSSGKGLVMVDALNDEGGIKVKVGDNKGHPMAVQETSARDVEDADEYTSSQDHTGGVTVHEMTESSEMEGDQYDQSAWFQTATGKMYGEEFIHRVSDPVDSSVTLHSNVNRIMSIHTTGGDNEEGMAFITQQEEVAEGTDGKRLDDNVYWCEEWESGSRGVNEMGVTAAVGDKDLQASDSELMQYSASPNVLTTRRIVVSEGITQVVHGEQKVAVVSLDED
ncbi:synemin [Heptranchias perlo]|uniref:synemin n=1 Tax=Heptranchias perlo TaxID=212740 RepID=UPI00355990FE